MRSDRLFDMPDERPQEYKSDEGKPRVELLPTFALEAASHAFAYGAKKYREWSWRGLGAQRTYASVLRHLFAWQRNEGVDKESGLPHLWMALSQMMILVEEDERERLGIDEGA